MNLLITFALAVTCFIFPKSRIVTILGFVFLWSLWGWNTWNGDYDAYSDIYYDTYYASIETTTVEKGYFILNKAALELGFSFQQFLVVISAVVLSLMLFFTLNIAKYPALYFLIYYFIFITEFVFIRNYISDTLLLLAFLLVFLQVKYNRFWFIVLVLVCCSFHYSSILFLIFLYPIYANTPLKFTKSLAFFLGLTAVSVYAFSSLLPFLGQQYIARLEYYTSDSFWSISIAHILLVIAIHFIYRQVLNNGNLDATWGRAFTIAYNVNIVSLIYLCGYYHVPYFSRVLKMLFALHFALIVSSIYFNSKRSELGKLVFPILFVLIIFALYFARTNFPFTIEPLYRNNLIWSEHT